MIELKPCPVCGSEAKTEWRSNKKYRWFTVYCVQCGTRIDQYIAREGSSDIITIVEDETIDKWNMRVYNEMH